MIRLPLAFLAPKLHLGTHLLRQFHCRSRSRAREGLFHRLTAAATNQREIEFRGEQVLRTAVAFPSATWERGVRFSFLALFLALALGISSSCAATVAPNSDAPVDFKHLPWTDGEALTYLISLSAFEAAQGTFVAHDKGDHWEFNLALASRGLVDDFYPFTGNFWCILAPPPWRSIEYGEYRFEPRRTIKERTRIDYSQHRGTREIWVDGKTKTFSVAEEAIDDVGTMLYHLRAGGWKPGDRRLLHVYESDSEKEALAECQARESRAFGIWPRQSLLRILVLPGDGCRLMLWMTDDARRLPVHAELAFRYGSFSIDLTKTSFH